MGSSKTPDEAVTPYLTLRDLYKKPCWNYWRGEKKAAEQKKVNKTPYSPITGQKLRPSHRQYYSTHKQAAYAMFDAKGLGYGMGLGIRIGAELDKHSLIGLDMDGCYDPKIGELDSIQREIFDRFESYTEISPSGTGVKTFMRCHRDDVKTIRQKIQSLRSTKGHMISWNPGGHREIKLVLSNGYFTVTNRKLSCSTGNLAIATQEDLEWLFDVSAKYMSQHSNSGLRTGKSQFKKGRDESGSGFGYRFMKDEVYDGRSFDEARANILNDDGKAGEWANRSNERQLKRAYKNAEREIRERNNCVRSAFDDQKEAKDPAVAEFNRRHALVFHNGRTLAATFHSDKRISFGPVEDLHKFNRNRLVPAGSGKMEPLSKRWQSSPECRKYAGGFKFIPGRDTPPDILNTWTGFAVEPDPKANCDLFLRHLKEVVCDGDEEAYAYFLGYLAHLIQRPFEKPGICIVLRGGKGAGKDVLFRYVTKVIGTPHTTKIIDKDQLLGRFNGHFETCLLAHMQEGYWAGSIRDESYLKGLITSEEMNIEHKGLKAYTAENFTRIVITTNEVWAVPTSFDERRFMVLDVSGARIGDAEYFKNLHQEMDGDGPAALLYFLQDYDLSDFDVRRPPVSQALTEQKLLSLRGSSRWLYEELTMGQIQALLYTGKDWEESEIIVQSRALYKDYLHWHRQQSYQTREEGDAIFGKNLKKLIPDIDRKRCVPDGGSKREWCYIIPRLDLCRKAFEQQLGSPIEWEN